MRFSPYDLYTNLHRPFGFTPFWVFLIGIAALLALCAVLYLVSHFRNRGKPPVERKGANLLGGAYGNGAVSGRPTGAGAFGGVPGASIPVADKDTVNSEDPRKR